MAKLFAYKDAESVLEKSFETRYIASKKGTTTQESTELNFLALNFDGVGSAIVEEIHYKKGSGLFGKADYSRKVKIMTAQEIKALVESGEYSIGIEESND